MGHSFGRLRRLNFYNVTQFSNLSVWVKFFQGLKHRGMKGEKLSKPRAVIKCGKSPSQEDGDCGALKEVKYKVAEWVGVILESVTKKQPPT